MTQERVVVRPIGPPLIPGDLCCEAGRAPIYQHWLEVVIAHDFQPGAQLVGTCKIARISSEGVEIYSLPAFYYRQLRSLVLRPEAPQP